jgi:hypothetical protein
MMTTESSSIVGRNNPALVAGSSFVPNGPLWPKAACQIIVFLTF